jgi:hypothetical protein
MPSRSNVVNRVGGSQITYPKAPRTGSYLSCIVGDYSACQCRLNVHVLSRSTRIAGHLASIHVLRVLCAHRRGQCACTMCALVAHRSVLPLSVCTALLAKASAQLRLRRPGRDLALRRTRHRRCSSTSIRLAINRWRHLRESWAWVTRYAATEGSKRAISRHESRDAKMNGNGSAG